jgi:hypothetical protein
MGTGTWQALEGERDRQTGTAKGKKKLGRHSHKRLDNNKMDLKEI